MIKDVIPLGRSWVITKYESEEAFEKGIHFDMVYISGNTLLVEGIAETLKLLTGLTAVNFGNANAFVGVGDSIEASASGQTGLQASTNKFYKAVDVGFPVITGSDVTWRATFGTSEGNFAWNEFTIANGNSDSAANLNRKVSSQGTKVSGQVWTVNLTITFQDAGGSTGGGGGTPGVGVIGYLGASLTMMAIEGAQTLGSLRFWNPIPTYGGAGITQWTAGLSSNPQSTTSANMDNFVLTGDPESGGGATWTYTSTDDGVSYNLKGNLFKPVGSGPFPGLVLSHGLGSTAPNGNTFRNTGLVSIATNYTHSSDTAGLLPSGNEGASTANIQRAHKCWDILRGLGYVDNTRIAASGHSMGAFVTAALVGTYPYDFKVAAHTAGGVNDSNVPWTKTAQANGIVIPYLLQHGSADATVPIADDATLDGILTTNGTIHNFITYTGFSHSDMINPANTAIQTAITNWFTTHGLYNANSNPFWTAFNNSLIAQPTNVFWLQLCAIANNSASETYANLVIWINQIKSRVPGAIVYISAQPQYVPTHTCSIAGSDGPDRMTSLVNQAVSNGIALPGPVVGPWDYNTDIASDGCHPNTTGKAVAGQQVMDFFYTINGGVSGGGGGGGGGTNYNLRPVGIYSLDSVVNKPFVSGVLKRVGWDVLETSQGVYNFSTLATIINSAAAANQKVSLVVFADRVPAYVLAAASATMTGAGGITPVPWDTNAQNRWNAMIQAMGNYVVGGFALKDHPTLMQVDCSIIGSQGIRLLPVPAGYTLALYKAACINAVDIVATVFSKKIIYVGLFGVAGRDADSRDIRDTLLATYNGITLPRINFFVETFTGKAPEEGNGTGALLFAVKDQTSIMGQACWQYLDRSQGGHCTWETVPSIQSMFDRTAVYNTTYLEVYNQDLNNAANNTLLTNAAATLLARYNTLIS